MAGLQLMSQAGGGRWKPFVTFVTISWEKKNLQGKPKEEAESYLHRFQKADRYTGFLVSFPLWYHETDLTNRRQETTP